jgi:hypothetical protein
MVAPTTYSPARLDKRMTAADCEKTTVKEEEKTHTQNTNIRIIRLTLHLKQYKKAQS